jgi:hypothetical protein
MANRYLAAGAVDLNSTASWSATFNGATGASVPVANDVVYILVGNQVINTNLSALNVDLNAVTIGPNFTGSLGTPGASATIGCSGVARAPFIIQSTGAYIYLAAGTASIDVLSVVSSANVWLTGGTTVEANLYLGTVSIGSSGVVTTCNVSGASVEAIDGTVFTTVNNAGGSIVDYRGATTVNVGGTARYTAAVSDAAYTTVNISGAPGTQGCVFNHKATGTLGTMNLYAGTYSVEGAAQNPVVTTANIYGTSSTTRYIYKSGLIQLTPGTENDYSLNAKMATQGFGGGSTGNGSGDL